MTPLKCNQRQRRRTYECAGYHHKITQSIEEVDHKQKADFRIIVELFGIDFAPHFRVALEERDDACGHEQRHLPPSHSSLLVCHFCDSVMSDQAVPEPSAQRSDHRSQSYRRRMPQCGTVTQTSCPNRRPHPTDFEELQLCATAKPFPTINRTHTKTSRRAKH
jgi:hypothetical protein